MKSILLSLSLLVSICQGQQIYKTLLALPRPVLSSDSTLLNGLISSWKFDELSGNATDSKGSNTLTNQNTAVFTFGKVNNGALLVSALTQNFSNGAPTGLNTFAFSLALWCKYTTLPSGGERMTFFSKFDGSDGSILLDAVDNGPWRFIVSTDAGNQALTESTFGTPTTATFYLVVITFDGTTQKISVNAGTQDSNAISGTFHVNNNPLFIGTRTGADLKLDGMIDAMCYWNRVLTMAEITEYYNGGSGEQIP